MKEIVVISGKGGAGKTSFCAALAHVAGNAVLCDLDVDAPDLHIILNPAPSPAEPFLSGHEARIREQDCLHCGTCEKICAFGAVRPGPVISPLACEGCGVCVHLCPAGAIDFPEKQCGEWQISETRFGPFVHARLYPGEENSGRLITLLKEKARETAAASGKELILYDGSPGIGCPVISSLSGAHLAVAVVEPTPSGRHDFERVAALCDHFHIPVSVVINKADLNPEEAESLAAWALNRGYDVAGRVPFSPDVTKAMVEGKAVTETPSGLAPILREIAGHILTLPLVPSKKLSISTL